MIRPPRPRVLIIGGGFGGLEAARALAKAPDLSAKALTQLQKLGVEVRLGGRRRFATGQTIGVEHGLQRRSRWPSGR